MASTGEELAPDRNSPASVSPTPIRKALSLPTGYEGSKSSVQARIDYTVSFVISLLHTLYKLGHKEKQQENRVRNTSIIYNQMRKQD